MSHFDIQRLSLIWDEFNAARASTQFALRKSKELLVEREFQGLRHRQLQGALEALEPTFIIRLFAEFEGCLHKYLYSVGKLPKYPTASSLIDQTTSKLHIDSGIQRKVHSVRRYRNKLAHIEAEEAEPVMIADVRSNLNIFLNRLP